jgi:hypothetical protein
MIAVLIAFKAKNLVLFVKLKLVSRVTKEKLYNSKQ